MNYYEHHIRDYDAATVHLTWDQDLAYTRLIRWYYRKEQPLPADVKEVCRLVRATTKLQKLAVSSVLEEFFILQENGWHHEVCDAVIEKFLAGEPERAAKKANENNRLAKHRGERAKLFKALTDAGESAPWNIKIDELRALVARVAAPLEARSATASLTTEDDSVTQPATAPATPATATQYPSTSTHPPSTNKKQVNLKPSEAKASGETPPSTQSDVPGEEPAGMTAQEQVWAQGVPLLVAAGQAERSARSLLGKWVKGHGAAQVADAIVSCAKAAPVEPVGWMIATLGKPAAKTRSAETSEVPWWVRAGFEKMWQAEGAGCSERYAGNWRDGARIPDEELRAAWEAREQAKREGQA